MPEADAGRSRFGPRHGFRVGQGLRSGRGFRCGGEGAAGQPAAAVEVEWFGPSRSPEVERQRGGSGASLRVVLQHRPHQGDQRRGPRVVRQVRPLPGRRLDEDVPEVVRRPGGPTREAGQRHRPQREDVGRRRRRAGPRQFRSSVTRRRADRQSELGRRSGCAEIGQQRAPGPVEDDVLRRDIAVDDLSLMRRRQGGGQRYQNRQGLPGRQPAAAGEQIGQVAAGCVLGDQGGAVLVGHHVKHGDDVRMVDRRRQCCFPVDCGQLIRREDLHRDRLPGGRADAEPYLGRAAAAEQLGRPVVPHREHHVDGR